MGKKIVYAVEKKYHGTTKVMFHSRSYEKARDYYFKHPKAVYIQKYVGGLYGLTAGSLQPRIPNKITYRRKKYTRAYVGPHQKKFATAVVKGFRKQRIPAQARKFKKGWFVFVKM